MTLEDLLVHLDGGRHLDGVRALLAPTLPDRETRPQGVALFGIGKRGGKSGEGHNGNDGGERSTWHD